MNIEQIDNSRILISVCDSEIAERYNTDYDRLGTDREEVRNILSNILEQAETRTGLSLSDKSLNVEIRKYDHGCIILITIQKPVISKKYTFRERSDTYTFFFNDFETLLLCAKRIYSLPYDTKGSMILYSSGCYCLIMQRMFKKSFVYEVINDYCTHCARGKFFAAAIREHSKTVCCRNAIKKMTETFCH